MNLGLVFSSSSASFFLLLLLSSSSSSSSSSSYVVEVNTSTATNEYTDGAPYRGV